MRATWDQTWMKVAEAMAARSKCVNRQVGAVVVDANNRPVSVGYNGAPAGFDAVQAWDKADVSSCASFCPRANSAARGSSYANCVSVHAEANALLFADRRSYAGGSIYVTNPCCWECAKLVANSGVARVVVKKSKVDAHADVDTPIEFLRRCGLQVEVLKEENK